MPPFSLLEKESELGTGGYGKVVKARDDATSELVAAKLIPLKRMKRQAIAKEVELMRKLKHPNIIGLLGTHEGSTEYIIYMELAERGELFSRVINSGSLSENEARPYFAQLMSAVKYMHENGVVHRDLKLENVLLDGHDCCKVCDFGLAHVYADSARPKLREVCGSKSYCAPEVLEGRGYDGFPTDMWSCGICLFAMLAGFFPLDEASGADWRFERVKLNQPQRISTCQTIFGFYERRCTLSAEVVALIDSMLHISGVDKRVTVEQALSSPWLMMQPPSAEGVVYRGMGGAYDMDQDALRKLISETSHESEEPLYRGGNVGSGGIAVPLLCKQAPMFCADFHEEE